MRKERQHSPVGDFHKRAYSDCLQCGARFYWFRSTRGVSYRVDADSIEWGEIEWVPEDAYDVPRFQRSKGHVEHACGAEAWRNQERRTRTRPPRGERRTHTPPPPFEGYSPPPPPPRSPRPPREDPFAVLGVSPSTPLDELKRVYRKLAFKHHPDKGGSEDRMKRINAAYDAVTAGRRGM